MTSTGDSKTNRRHIHIYASSFGRHTIQSAILRHHHHHATLLHQPRLPPHRVSGLSLSLFSLLPFPLRIFCQHIVTLKNHFNSHQTINKLLIFQVEAILNLDNPVQKHKFWTSMVSYYRELSCNRTPHDIS